MFCLVLLAAVCMVAVLCPYDCVLLVLLVILCYDYSVTAAWRHRTGITEYC